MSDKGGGSFLDVLLGGLKRVLRNGTPMPVRPNVNLIGFAAVLDNPSLNSTDVFAGSGGGGSSGGTSLVIESNGAPLPLEPSLNFIGFDVADNPGSTRTDVGRSLTAHAVLVGNATSPIATVGPGTSGLPLVGAGGSADPAFATIALATATTGTLAVGRGGTGDTSLTAHAVVVGEGASALATAGPGASGTILQGKGGSADPAFTAWTIADPGATRNVLTSDGTNWTSTPPGASAVVVVSGTHTMQPGEEWAEVHPGDVVTMPATPVAGLELLFVGVGSGFSFNPVQWNGNGPNLEEPDDPNNLDGSHAPAASVRSFQENGRWRFRFNGTLYRSV